MTLKQLKEMINNINDKYDEYDITTECECNKGSGKNESI